MVKEALPFHVGHGITHTFLSDIKYILRKSIWSLNYLDVFLCDSLATHKKTGLILTPESTLLLQIMRGHQVTCCASAVLQEQCPGGAVKGACSAPSLHQVLAKQPPCWAELWLCPRPGMLRGGTAGLVLGAPSGPPPMDRTDIMNRTGIRRACEMRVL